MRTLQEMYDELEDIGLEADQQLKSRASHDDARAALKLISKLVKLMLSAPGEID